MKILTKLINTTYETGEWPKDFTEVTMIALKKKTQATKRSDHSTISLIAQKQRENVECFKYLGSMLTNDGRYTCEITPRIAMAKAEFNKKKTLFTSKLDLNLGRN